MNYTILYIDMQNNLQIINKEATQIELEKRTIELSFPQKALIVSPIKIDNKEVDFPDNFINDYEALLIKNVAYSGLKIPFTAYREENKVFEFPIM